MIKEKQYQEEVLKSEVQFLEKMKVKLNTYEFVEKNGIKFYCSKQDKRIVAIQTSENCLAICTTTKEKNKCYNINYDTKHNFVVMNCYNPVFVLFSKGQYESLKEEITLIARMIKSAGNLNLYTFIGDSLVIGQFPYEKEYKIPNNMFYNTEKQKLNIKSIAAMTREENLITIKSEDRKEFGFNFRYSIHSIILTSDHSNYAYLCEEQTKEQKTKKLVK